MPNTDRAAVAREVLTDFMGAAQSVEAVQAAAKFMAEHYPAPIPLGAPRRWWLVVDDSGDLFAYSREHHARNVWGNLAQIVPVLEARVTRETVDMAATKIREEIDGLRWGEAIDCVRAALSALGLTVEE